MHCIFFKADTMKWYWVKTNRLIKKLFRGFVWDIPSAQKTVYLTFDDGPIPEITEWVLNLLEQHEIKATFFCIGNNIEKHPDIFRKVVNADHAIGNHTFNHINGWDTGFDEYMDNIILCQKEIVENGGDDTRLFRPPYGKIKGAQASAVRKLGYKIIMWDVLSADFDYTISPEECLKNVTKNATNGSVIIFHDSIKAFTNLEYALPRAIGYLKENGYAFGTIS